MARKYKEDLNTLPMFSRESSTGDIPSDVIWRWVPGPRHQIPVMPGPFAALDFECFYTDTYSLTKMTPFEYVNNPNFNAYLIAIEWFDGTNWWRWVGHPSKAPWHSITGIPWVSHNANFDELVYRKLEALGIIPKGHRPELWYCTMDFAAYMQFDRGLEAVAPALLGEPAIKDVRKQMKNTGASADAVKDYAAGDSRQCAWIWALYHHTWPELEKILSIAQRRAGYAGVWCDVPLMNRAKKKMRDVQLQIAMRIPWANKHSVTGVKGLIIECAKRGIPTPPPAKKRGTDEDGKQPGVSLDDPAVAAWAKKWDKDKWLDDIFLFTKARQLEAHVDMMLARLRKDGTVPFELIYRKAPHTARWQSGGGLRMQNLDKEDVEGFNPRFFIHARPNTKLLIADLSQIEPRTGNWLVGDQVFLDACAKGQSPYDAHARSTMAYTDPRPLKKFDKGLYALAKARLLALGYQAGPPKFCEMARTMAQIIVFESEKSYCPSMDGDSSKWEFFRASQIKDRIERNDLQGWSIFPSAEFSVRDFRDKSPLIVNEWQRGENQMRAHIGGDYFVPLPNGSVIRYYDVGEHRYFNEERNRWESELTAWVIKDSKNPKQKKYLYGGKLFENKVQRVARDVLADMIGRILKIDPRRLRFRWSVHDEIIAEAPTADAKFLFEEMLHVMKTPPVWARGLPVSAEGAEFELPDGTKVFGILDHYVK